MTELPEERGHLETERANPRSRELDRLSTAAAFDVMNAEDARVAGAVAAARAEIVAAIDLIAARLERGGRLFYVGAGTSGRLGALDAAECPPTFQSEPQQVQAVLAGGSRAMTEAVEGAEDSREEARAALEARGLSERDVVFGITAGGTTPFVHAAVELARERGAGSVFFACVPRDEAPDAADVSIRVLTGREVVTGSTRLKAGTATKLVLNTVSTLVMTKLGKVHGNLMVDVRAGANRKLRDRGIRLVVELCGVERAEAAALLERAGWAVKPAVVMQRRGVGLDEARALLAAAGGSLRRALG